MLDRSRTMTLNSDPGPNHHESPWPTSRLAELARRPLVAPLAGAMLAMIISVIGISEVSLWVDEGYTNAVASRSLPEIWRMLGTIDAVHGTYYLIMHGVIEVFGNSPIALRAPSLIMVGVAAAGVYVLTRRLIGWRAALAATLVFAILPRVTWMGIEARSYAFTAAAAVWLTVLLLAILRRPTVPRLIGYAALAALGFALNLFFILLIPAHGVALLLDSRIRFSRRFWAWLGAAVVGTLAGLPVLVEALSQSGQIGKTSPGPLGYLRQVLVNQWFLGETPTIFLSGSGGGLLEGVGSDLWKYSSVLLALVSFALMAYVMWRRPRPEADRPEVSEGVLPGALSVAVTWLAVPSILLVGFSVAVSPMYNARYLTFAAPAVAILLGAALVRLSGWKRWVAAVLLILLALPIYVSQRGPFAKSGADWKQISEFVVAHRGPDQAVYFAPRLPPTSAVVRTTARTAAYAYPDAFRGLVDLTLEQTATDKGDLVGESRLLAASLDRLDGIRDVFVITRVDYPAELRSADEQLLLDAGFRPGDSYSGPLDTVTEYVR